MRQIELNDETAEVTGAIRATRSLVTVRDRDALQRLAGASYGLSEHEYRRVLG
jgi:hypothetical protein